MKTRMTDSELQQFYNQPCVLPRDIVVYVNSILEADKESKEFLIGFASALLLLAKTETLSSSLQLIVAASIRECAISINNRNDSHA